MAGFWKNLITIGKNKEGGGVRPYETPTIKMEFGEALLQFIARSRVNQLESRSLFEDGGEPEGKTKAILDRSHFRSLRKISAHKVSLMGKQFMVAIPSGDSYILDSYDIFKIVDGTLDNPKEIHLNTSSVYIQDDQEFQIQLELKWNGLGKAMLSQFIVNEDGKRLYIEGSEYIYPQNLSRLPGQIMKANYLGKPDVDMASMRTAITHFDFHANELTTEWKYVSTKIRNNPNFSDLEDEELERFMEEAKRILPENSYNNKLQQGQEVFTSGSQSITFNQINIQFLEDKILKYAGVTRDSSATGTNKHSLEITLQNQFATEILYSIKDIKEFDYKMIFRTLSELTGEDNYEETVNLKVSIIEEAKLALLEESVQTAKNNGSEKKNA